ncbi:MAG: hypothetical protein QXF12_05770 [Candidatus Aenigmatarchaeota archaeon]
MRKGVSIAITLGEFMGLVIFLCLVILLFRLVSGDLIKFNVEKELYVESGKAVNLGNYILTSSDLVVNIDGFSQKVIVSKQKLDEYNMKNQKLDCCDYLDYDYAIEIEDLSSGEKYSISYFKEDLNKLFELGKKCRQFSQGIAMKSYSMPMVIYDEISQKKSLAKMSIYMAKTPVSLIAEQIVNSCINQNYENVMPIYGFSFGKDFTITKNQNEYLICTKTITDSYMCKSIVCNKEINTKRFSEHCKDNDNICSTLSLRGKCGYVVDDDCNKNSCSYLIIKSNEKEVNLCFSAEKDSGQC